VAVQALALLLLLTARRVPLAGFAPRGGGGSGRFGGFAPGRGIAPFG
jgi:hypothetical protein